jgi:hypothetical protein
MFPRIPATPRCAALSSHRLEILPSRRLACAWLLWLAIAVATVLVAPLPWPVRLALCVTIATSGVRCVAGVVLLRGRLAIRRLDWDVNGNLWVGSGHSPVSHPARVASGSFRLGPGLLVLRLETASGTRSVCIDSRLQDPAAFRRLTRAIPGLADTIDHGCRPKV